MEEYKILSEVYDILNPKEEIFDQKPFFEALIKQYSVARVLDCACGTGWHLSMFHDMGIASFGSDISPDMLARAKTNLEGKYIPLKQEDFRTLENSWGDRFDMIACLTTSLPHMLTDEDIVVAINSMYERLNDGGVLVVSNGITDALLDAKPKFIPAKVNANDAFFFICEYDGTKTMTFNILYVEKTEFIDHRFTSITYNAMRRSTLERAFAQTKFRSIYFYGDWDMSEYSAESSSKLILVAEK